ncbi:hypothetical protein BVRB_3g067460 [Beta vulgaris subsp. vulgaris]|uniref:Uncharacterized protein n=1 Tax=Beta vulgaris subsp. vulgaris TaxID=3555 RepID=A0A0J8E6X0_BETVV|nr:hypothetical protein BVRB_3g067460 [Beta vulgaris subsp. vulgaris]
MEAFGTVLSAAQTLLAALQCSQLKDILSTSGYKSQLEDLQLTVSTINAVLSDAETKEELSHEAQLWIKQLKDAVFEADDLFDEFVTLTEQKQLVEAGGSLSKKASRFFSRTHNPLSLAYRMSQGVKDINKKLDKIANNSQQFGFKIDSEPIRKRRPETCSYVNQVEIIGRQHDLDHIVGTYLTSNDQHLSYNQELEVLPKSITKLYNLQTLILSSCMGLKELPKDLSKLVKLRVLNIRDCNNISSMPRDMGKLSGLERLSNFVVGGDRGSSSTSSYVKQVADELEDLKALNNLKGSLQMRIINGQNFVNEDDSRVMQALPREGLYLMHKEYLSTIEFYFFGKIKDDVDLGAITSLMEDLRPHSNLKELYVFRYGGVRMPWINHLPKRIILVKR